ncbi:MAG: alanine racemase, partial [Candidatus Zixiibacteriota bacterium]
EPTIYNLENLRAWAREARKRKRRAPIHLKVETGANRQGIAPESLGEFAAELQRAPELTPLGVSTHFANIEDTTDHTFAKLQLSRFQAALKTLERLGASPQLRHTASSAAHLVFPETRFDMIRAGIAMYGHWPSKETFLSFRHQYPNHDGRDALRPMLSFKCRIAQIKTVKKGETVGYGLSFTAERDLKIAVLPVGYFDGLDRKLSNVGHVLIGGQRARIVGRVSMNNMTVDVTELAHEKENLLEAVVTLIGVDGAERITAEMIADWTGTIQYEALARLGESLPRVVI